VLPWLAVLFRRLRLCCARLVFDVEMWSAGDLDGGVLDTGEKSHDRSKAPPSSTYTMLNRMVRVAKARYVVRAAKMARGSDINNRSGGRATVRGSESSEGIGTT